MFDPNSWNKLPLRTWRTVGAYQQWAMMYFCNRGFMPVASAAIVGNISQESGMNPDAIRPNDAGPGIDSRGLAQWNRGRLQRLLEFNPHAFDSPTQQERFYIQLAFVVHELFTTHKAARHELITGPQDETLAGTFGKLYEGFGDESIPARVAYAKSILATYQQGMKNG